MISAHTGLPELPNFVELLAKKLGEGSVFGKYLLIWQSVIFSLLAVIIISVLAYLGARKRELVPGRLQNAMELIFGGLDDFICGILGKEGRRLVPFIGTLFIYILFLNLFGLVPFMKSSTSSLSTTLGLALCVFVYVHYTALRQLGFLGYIKHLMGNPNKALALTVVLPVFLFFMHVLSELIHPISLSLRLRSNIFADDMLLAAVSGFGLRALPLLIFCMLLVIVSAVVQAVVFSLLSTVYFALFLKHED